MDDHKTAGIFKALGDENRIRILKLLCSGEKCACHLLETLNISQPTLSHHMKILCDTGLVTGRKEGKWMHYTIHREGICQVTQLVHHLLSPEDFPVNCRCGENCTCESAPCREV